MGKRLLVLTALLGLTPALVAEEPKRPAHLTVGVVQLALEPDLAKNRDQMLSFAKQASDKGCRVVVFPETALYSPAKTPRAK